MALTLEQTNEIRKRMGQEPLAELPAAPAASNPEEDEERKKAAAEVEKNKQQQQGAPAAPVSQPEATIDEQAVLKFLVDRGISISSIDDLSKPVTQEDIQKKAEERDNAKLTFGLNKGLFNRKTHEQFILDRNDKQNLVYTHYYQEAKKEDPSLSDEEIQTEFAEKYGLSAEPNTRKHKRGQEELNLLGDHILRNKYANIYKLDSEYDSHEANLNQQRDFENQIKAKAPAYKADVEDVFKELKKITTKLGEDEEYEVEVVDEALDSLKSKFLDAGYVASKISQGYTKEQLKDTAYTALLREQWPTLVKKMIEQAMHKKQKGVRGIVPVSTASKEAQQEISEVQQKIHQRVFPNQPAAVN